jgi:hypothetical protein
VFMNENEIKMKGITKKVLKFSSFWSKINDTM